MPRSTATPEQKIIWMIGGEIDRGVLREIMGNLRDRSNAINPTTPWALLNSGSGHLIRVSCMLPVGSQEINRFDAALVRAGYAFDRRNYVVAGYRHATKAQFRPGLTLLHASFGGIDHIMENVTDNDHEIQVPLSALRTQETAGTLSRWLAGTYPMLPGLAPVRFTDRPPVIPGAAELTRRARAEAEGRRVSGSNTTANWVPTAFEEIS